MTTRGIVLAGGSGSRLWPATHSVSKQLIPVYDKPMIYYPVTTLMLAGIREILLVSTPRDLPIYEELLGNGSQWGIEISYAVQETPAGLAQALLIAESFLKGEPSVLILGDNLMYGSGLGRNLSTFTTNSGAAITAYEVADPSGLGVVVFDSNGDVSDLIEKPTNSISKWAIPGIYFYDGSASERAKTLRPSSRGELEITDLNRTYLKDGLLQVHKLPRGTAWLDLGTPGGLLEASQFVRTLEERQGLLLGSPDEVAFNFGWISRDFLYSQFQNRHSAYAERVAELCQRENLDKDF
jgi:glucose-1-phosphate thymidylyltransferase